MKIVVAFMSSVGDAQPTVEATQEFDTYHEALSVANKYNRSQASKRSSRARLFAIIAP